MWRAGVMSSGSTVACIASPSISACNRSVSWETSSLGSCLAAGAEQLDGLATQVAHPGVRLVSQRSQTRIDARSRGEGKPDVENRPSLGIQHEEALQAALHDVGTSPEASTAATRRATSSVDLRRGDRLGEPGQGTAPPR
jgi:hypothetical protein